jgi:hypothetical protein
MKYNKYVNLNLEITSSRLQVQEIVTYKKLPVLKFIEAGKVIFRFGWFDRQFFRNGINNSCLAIVKLNLAMIGSKD